MSAAPKKVSEYLEELERDVEGKPDQVREGIEIYVGLWRKALQKGVVSETDEVPAALAKVEERGGLYKAAED